MLTSESRLAKWGNGRALRLSKEACEAVGVEVGDALSVEVDEFQKLIRISPKGRNTLSALMEGYDGPKPGEIDPPGPSVGKEVW